MHIVDLSLTISPTPEGTPEAAAIEITYLGHEQGAADIENYFAVPRSLLRLEEGWSIEYITRLSTHGTTHVDAPWHYNSKIGGKKAPTIEELPLEWFFNDGVKLRFSHQRQWGSHYRRRRGKGAQADKLRFKTDGYHPYVYRKVLVRSRGVYIQRLRCYRQETTRWLYDKGVRVVGIDAWGWTSARPGGAEGSGS